MQRPTGGLSLIPDGTYMTSDGTNCLDFAIMRQIEDKIRIRMNSNVTTRELTYSGNTNGYWSLRKTNNTVYCTRNGVVIGNVTVTTTALPNSKLGGLVNLVNTVTPASRAQNKLGAVITGEYLSEAEDLILHTEMLKLSNSVGILFFRIASDSRFW